jgi:predicted ATP-dependent endonuclease of OLD family
MSKIKKNTVSNLKALSSFTAEFNGATAIITGRNNSGKSSFLRSLPDRFRGIKPSIILKTGESEGFQEMELTTGEKLLWSFDNKTAKGERLIYIYNDPEGKEIRTSVTKEIMDRFFPGSFDIDIFLNSTPAKQRKMLQDIVGLDFTLLDDRYQVAYDERTLANKKLQEAKLKLQPVDEKLAFDDAEKGAENLKKQKTDNEGIMKSLEAQIKKLQNDNKDIDKRLTNAQAWLTAPENKKKDDDYHFTVSQELAKAQEDNLKIAKNNKALADQKDVLKLDLEAKEMDKAVKAIENEKTELIRGAKMPEGFGFTNDGITYNGLPVSREQLSSSAIYIAALKLASMSIGEVRTLHFDASFLDKVSLAEIEAWANDQDLQLLIEMPDREAGEIRYELIENIK